ncbi:GNAT family N-acetyltransferase [Citroniella saccharovorans]|uniref:GNAT family N-acetyltransferase n=1 Tax=Citroniella saccharovorans TaxID=2053367 RepID=A0AAW9MTF8_9FIRM|nr:GNAT family N-acetyltransferase [Citroniella saccharovorans]MEB3429295.1 GNAT family N-acetyltransferase [Citroniella saccharovorans]
MKYTFEKLNKENFSKYYDYLSLATALEPEIMCSTDINKEELYERLDDELTKRSTSILAMYEDKVVGRVEYHFYSCFQDGYRICYVDWVYVLPENRNKGIAKNLFNEMTIDCVKHNIDEIRLIRSTNKNANDFYESFKSAKICELPFFIQHLY